MQTPRTTYSESVVITIRKKPLHYQYRSYMAILLLHAVGPSILLSARRGGICDKKGD